MLHFPVDQTSDSDSDFISNNHVTHVRRIFFLGFHVKMCIFINVNPAEQDSCNDASYVPGNIRVCQYTLHAEREEHEIMKINNLN